MALSAQCPRMVIPETTDPSLEASEEIMFSPRTPLAIASHGRAPSPSGTLLRRATTVLWDWLSRPNHGRAVRSFRRAALEQDSSALRGLLNPSVLVAVQSADSAEPRVRVVRGLDDAVTLLLRGMGRKDGLTIIERPVDGQAGLILEDDNGPFASVYLDYSAGLVTTVYIKLQPTRLHRWRTP